MHLSTGGHIIIYKYMSMKETMGNVGNDNNLQEFELKMT